MALAPRAFQQSLPEGLYRALLVMCSTLGIPERAEILTMLIPSLPDSFVEETFALMLTLPAEEQEEILALLLPRTPATLAEQALQNVFTCGEQKRAEYLLLLAPRLSGKQIAGVFQQALTLPHPKCATLLAALASRLTGKMLERALDLALSDVQAGETTLLAALVLHLTGRLLRKALIAILGVIPGATCSEALAVFAAILLEKLASPLRPESCQYALEQLLLYAREAEAEQACMLVGCAADGASWLWEKVLYAALQLPERVSDSCRVLAGFIPERKHADVLILLAAQLAEQTLQRALQMVHHYPPAERLRALVGLAPSLSDELRLQALREALTLPAHLCQQAAAVLFVPEKHPDILIRLVPSLGTDAQLRTALELTLALCGEESARVLKVLAPSLSTELVDLAMQVILAKRRPESLQLLLALAPRFTHAHLQQAVNVALVFASWEDARKLFMQACARERVSVLQSLLPWLCADSLKQALALLLDLSTSERATIIRSLMFQFSGPALLLLIETLLHLPYEERAQLLACLLPGLTGSQLQHVRLSAQGLAVEERTQVLLSLRPYMPDQEVLVSLLLCSMVELLFSLPHLSYEDFVARGIGEELLFLTQGFPLAHEAIEQALQEIPRRWVWI
jgi:hypothetical protein